MFVNLFGRFLPFSESLHSISKGAHTHTTEIKKKNIFAHSKCDHVPVESNRRGRDERRQRNSRQLNRYIVLTAHPKFQMLSCVCLLLFYNFLIRFASCVCLCRCLAVCDKRMSNSLPLNCTYYLQHFPLQTENI